MDTVLELIRAVEASGGHLSVDGLDLVIRPAAPALPIAAELRKY